MIEIIKIIIPALLVLITVYILLDKMLKNDQNQKLHELHKKNISTTTPLRLRAYERLMLVLDRTSPTNLIVANYEHSMTCFDLQSKLHSTIREEFGHNASQQIYVSNELWTAIRATQESLVKLINLCSSQFTPDTPATALAEKIIEIYSQSEQSPGEVASELLKKEVRGLF
jgi:hypothetical protein